MLVSGLSICCTHLIFAGQLISTYLAVAVAVHSYQRHAEAYTTRDYTVYYGVPRCGLELSYY